jgi:hypothetical protein
MLAGKGDSWSSQLHKMESSGKQKKRGERKAFDLSWQVYLFRVL